MPVTFSTSCQVISPERTVLLYESRLEYQSNSGVVPHPGLVFAVSGRVWKVWAVKGSARPAPQSELFQAPYFNVYSSGSICKGNVLLPDGATVEKINAWNESFFDSFFTHPNVTGKLVKYQGGACSFWRDMLDGGYARFPQRVLVPIGATLNDLVS